MVYIVFEVVVAAERYWAWCLAGSGVGFDDITYTKPDGETIVDAPGTRLPKGRYLFEVAAGES